MGARTCGADYAHQSLAATTAKSWYLTTETLQLAALSAQNVQRDATEAVRIANIHYKASLITLLSVLQLQTAQIASQAEVIKLRNAQLANRINLHLALGGSFDAAPATVAARTTAK